MKKNILDSIIKELSQTLKKELGENIKDIILFGSRARDEILRFAQNDIFKCVMTSLICHPERSEGSRYSSMNCF